MHVGFIRMFKHGFYVYNVWNVCSSGEGAIGISIEQ